MWQAYVMRLVIFGMLSAVVLVMMPREIYKKYMKFVLGFLLMVILLEPVEKLLGEDGGLRRNVEQMYQDIRALEQEAGYAETDAAYWTLLQSLYEQQVQRMGEQPWVEASTQEGGED